MNRDPSDNRRLSEKERKLRMVSGKKLSAQFYLASNFSFSYISILISLSHDYEVLYFEYLII